MHSGKSLSWPILDPLHFRRFDKALGALVLLAFTDGDTLLFIVGADGLPAHEIGKLVFRTDPDPTARAAIREKPIDERLVHVDYPCTPDL